MSKAVGAAFEQLVASLICRERPNAAVWTLDARSQRYGSDLFGIFDGAWLDGDTAGYFQCKAYDATPGFWRRMVDQLPAPACCVFEFWALHRERPTVLRVWRNRRLADGGRVWEEREVAP